jgi:transglutaminase-like putative cysteine protease
MMEARMHPRSEAWQRCFTFQLSVSPKARIFSYTDHLGNVVHHFDIPAHHRELTLIADALVDVEHPPTPPESMGPEAWRDLDRLIEAEDYWEMLMPSTFAHSTPALEALARELGVDKRRADPLVMLREISAGIHETFDYVRKSTAVDSPIDDALKSRSGVCQDFTHIMIALARGLRIPCRYVSGYLYRSGAQPETGEPRDGATHSWAEAMLPGIGWVGFDPTHNCLAGTGHIRAAIGRDYADVPPTTGTLKGPAKSELQVRVRVTPSEAIQPPDQEFTADEEWSRSLEEDQESQLVFAQQQQQ